MKCTVIKPLLSPYQVLTRLASKFKYPFLLESGRYGEYSFIGADPFLSIMSRGGKTYVNGIENFKSAKDPLGILRALLKKYSVIEKCPYFYGGAVGYISYNYATDSYKINKSEDDLGLPDIFFLLVDNVFVFKHRSKELFLYSSSPSKTKAFLNAVSVPVSVTPLSKKAGFKSNFTIPAFVRMIRRAKKYIRKGDIYQANLSQRFHICTSTNPLKIYEKLSKINPSPFSCYVDFGEFQIISSSPERLVKVENRRISARPIAGTRRKDMDKKVDRRLKRELIENEKERAEHIMLVDLARNDVGKVAEFGSVVVNELLKVEQYSHVQHLVSNVCGILRKDKDGIDLLKSMFPGGTITGAPKLRAMEIIDELEGVKRGLYTGSLGYICFNGDIDFNILIRTIIKIRDDAYVQVGAGIVYDSEPLMEYRETLLKAKAMLSAIM